MKKLIFFCFLLIFQFGISQKIEDKALLWEISGKGLTKPSFLYGTVHLSCQGEVVMTENLKNAFDATDQLLMEADLSDPTLPMKMLKISIAEDGKKLSDRLDKVTYSKLDSLIQSKLSVSLSNFDLFKPQVVLTQISVLGSDCPMDLGFDMMFMETAQEKGKKIVGMESMETQIDALFSLTDEESVKAIKYIANHFDELQKQTVELFDLYKKQDIQGLYNLTATTFDDPEYPQGDVKKMLDDRNIAWIPMIENEISKTPSFIACGAAHLAGEQGVINLLRKQGYTLTPVK